MKLLKMLGWKDMHLLLAGTNTEAIMLTKHRSNVEIVRSQTRSVDLCCSRTFEGTLFGLARHAF